MTVSNNFVFLTEASSAQSSNEFAEFSADQLLLEVSGTATSFSLRVCMYLDNRSGEYTDVAVINMTDLSVGESITKKGVYACSIAGSTRIKIILDSVSGGYINVFGRSLIS